MKTLGITRKIDSMGRLVIPTEIRKMLGLNNHDPVELFMDGDTVIVKKYLPHCIFCGEAKEITEYKGKRICQRCLKELNYESN